MQIRIRQTFASFLRCEDGAVTVDWVVLTAAIVGFGVIVGPTIGQQTITLAGLISGQVASVQVGAPAPQPATPDPTAQGPTPDPQGGEG